LLDRTALAVFLEAARIPDGPLGRALATAITHAADQTFRDVVAEAIRKRDMVRAWTEHAGSIEAATAGLCGMLDVDAHETAEQIDARTIEGDLIPSSQWHAVAAALDQGSKSD